MSKVLVVCADKIGTTMAGPAIRCWEMARLLARHGHDVRVSIPMPSEREPEGFELVVASERSLAREEQWADVIVVQGLVLTNYPILATTEKHLVVDLYDPFTLETIEMYLDKPADFQASQYWVSLSSLLLQLRIGDLFLCATERQRDFWMGCLLTADRINPETVGDDRLLRRLVDLAPFGTSAEPPVHSGKPAAKGVLAGVEKDARLAIWAGGVYNWFDPLSLVRAWPRVMKSVPEARLLFLGLKHPNPTNPEMEMSGRLVALAGELGLRDRGVSLNTGWVDYERRQDFLLESDLGVSMHFQNLETRLSFRTRYLDYIWAGLPCVGTEGDAFAEWIAANGTGRVVRYEDVDGIAAAVIELLGDETERERCAARVIEQQPLFTWEHALAPLVAYCADPWRAADLQGGKKSARGLGPLAADNQPPPGLVGRTVWFWRREGTAAVTRRVARKLRQQARLRLRQ